MFNYWITPPGLGLYTKTVFVDGTSSPDPVQGGGYAAFWSGTLWGRSMALQGDSSMSRYDMFVNNGSELDYIGEFEAYLQTNAYPGYSDYSSSYHNPIVWMYPTMTVGQVITTTFASNSLLNDERVVSADSNFTAQVSLDRFWDNYTWKSPETGKYPYKKVVQFTYQYPNNPQSKETYWLAHNYGPIRAQLSNTSNPKNPYLAYVVFTSQDGQNSDPNSPPVQGAVSFPSIPWFDPFVTNANYDGHANTAYVPNGYFLINTGTEGGASQ